MVNDTDLKSNTKNIKCDNNSCEEILCINVFLNRVVVALSFWDDNIIHPNPTWDYL